MDFGDGFWGWIRSMYTLRLSKPGRSPSSLWVRSISVCSMSLSLASSGFLSESAKHHLRNTVQTFGTISSGVMASTSFAGGTLCESDEQCKSLSWLFSIPRFGAVLGSVGKIACHCPKVRAMPFQTASFRTSFELQTCPGVKRYIIPFSKRASSSGARLWIESTRWVAISPR